MLDIYILGYKLYLADRVRFKELELRRDKWRQGKVTSPAFLFLKPPSLNWKKPRSAKSMNLSSILNGGDIFFQTDPLPKNQLTAISCQLLALHSQFFG